MKTPYYTIFLSVAGALLCGCVHKLDPAGEAITRIAVTDSQVASLREPFQLEKLDQVWGPHEAQPGPVVTYKSADHAGQFFWIYYEREDYARIDSRLMIHHIVRADRIAESGVVVWPPRFVGRPVTDAGSDMR